MKIKLIPNTLLSLVIATVGMGYGACQKTDGPPKVVTPSPTPTPTPTVDFKTPNTDNPLPQIATANTAMIYLVEKDVSLKARGSTAFVPILHGIFREGDTLQVGDQSRAWVSCPDHSVCPLGKGLYAECCRDVCDDAIRIPPPANTSSQTRAMFISKNELPAAELQVFQTQENRIRNLGANEVTTKFLMADLYSSWKLVEAKDELKDLTQKLNEPGAKRELKMIYVPILQKVGDLQLMVEQQKEAENSYKKAVDTGARLTDPRDKADAKVSLGEFYGMTGQKQKAVLNLKQGVKLYEKGGDTKKAEATREAISFIQKG